MARFHRPVLTALRPDRHAHCPSPRHPSALRLARMRQSTDSCKLVDPDPHAACCRGIGTRAVMTMLYAMCPGGRSSRRRGTCKSTACSMRPDSISAAQSPFGIDGMGSQSALQRRPAEESMQSSLLSHPEASSGPKAPSAPGVASAAELCQRLRKLTPALVEGS